MSNIEEKKSELPTMEDIKDLSFHEHVIHQMLVIQHKHGLTDEQTLIMMVLEMTKLKNGFMQQSIDLHMKGE